MKDQSILFSAPMIRALLADRKTQTRRLAAPRWKPGAFVWVREAWQDYCPLWSGHWCGHGTLEGVVRSHQPVYRADPEDQWLRGEGDKRGVPLKWKPSIHMPRWASRLTLEITAVRQERLQDISYEDCRDEGVTCPIHGNVRHVACTGLRDGYHMLWDDINGAGSNYAWSLNPLVWVTSFAVHKANIDAVKAALFDGALAPHAGDCGRPDTNHESEASA